MIEADAKSKKITRWQEYIDSLPDAGFFEIMRMYLGEIKTPYNKQNLIENLEGFLRKEENQRVISELLSEEELQIICAVKFLKSPTQEVLSAFFAAAIPYLEFQKMFTNLEERLILFRKITKTTSSTDKLAVEINPILEDRLSPLLRKQVLLKLPTYATRCKISSTEPVQPLFLASFISYLKTHPNLLRIDGSLRKKAILEINRIFPGKLNLCESLSVPFENLGLLKRVANNYEVDALRFDQFAKLKASVQCAYLCVATRGRYSRQDLMRRAKLLLECANSIPQEGFTRDLILRSAFIINKENEAPAETISGSAPSRFSVIVRREETDDSDFKIENPYYLKEEMNFLIDSAIVFGILAVSGKTKNEFQILVKGPVLRNEEKQNEGELPKTLNIDSGFTATIHPGLPLSALIPLTDFLDVTRFDKIAVMSLTRKSAARGFDRGMTAAKIISILEQLSLYEVPQSLKVMLEEWNTTYSSVSLYYGFVLKVASDNAVLTEKNSKFAQYISAKIAPGTYLLSVNSKEEAAKLLVKNGFDFIGKVKTASSPIQDKGFIDFEYRHDSSVASENGVESAESADSESSAIKTANLAPESVKDAHFAKMREVLEQTSMSDEQRMTLLDRIEKKIILNSTQLKAENVRFENLEATGIDFMGKLRVIESAIASGMLVELFYERSAYHLETTITGFPISISKEKFDTYVTLILESERRELIFSVSQAKRVRRLRASSVLQNNPRD